MLRPGSWVVLLGFVGVAGGAAVVSGWERPLPQLAAILQGGRYLGPGSGVKQLRANDCGPAALAECLRRLGTDAPYPDPESGVRLGPRGCGFADLVAEAERYGHCAAHQRVDPDSVRRVRAPAVLYLRRGHFVVYEGRGEDGEVVIHDPAVGRLAIAPRALARIWSGDVLVFARAPAGPGPPPP